MRSIVLIAVLVVLAAATGCRKEVIRPTCSPQVSEPVTTTALRSATSDEGTETEGTVSSGVNGGGQTSGGITDPNSDPSGDKKKKQ